ncbi:hypothetical protein [Rhizobium alvei]|uniref:Phage tail protein n=1 Tax=Rhizobium alvei TaxID=1132659 RepID=A0ABT8YUN7_9HYPH|nr:hypothetical protein [Rhizobium alvei]MDO6966997.1 hypothetical protein [Rhizobium alvei]
MSTFIHWPLGLLTPESIAPVIVPFTRSGGRSLGGVEPVTRTDLGYWEIAYGNVPVIGTAKERTWNAIAAILSGRSGLIVVPLAGNAAQPYASDEYELPSTLTHSDGSTFSDGTGYRQGAISIRSAGAAAEIGATTMRLRVDRGSLDLAGARFSYKHALYQIGQVLSVSGKVVQVTITPSIAATIPLDSSLEFDNPTCLCHLADDRGMDGGYNADGFEQRSVTFREATDYWSSLVA